MPWWHVITLDSHNESIKVYVTGTLVPTKRAKEQHRTPKLSLPVSESRPFVPQIHLSAFTSLRHRHVTVSSVLGRIVSFPRPVQRESPVFSEGSPPPYQLDSQHSRVSRSSPSTPTVVTLLSELTSSLVGRRSIPPRRCDQESPLRRGPSSPSSHRLVLCPFRTSRHSSVLPPIGPDLT